MDAHQTKETQALALILQRLGECLDTPMEVSEAISVLQDQPLLEHSERLIRAAQQLGVQLARSDLTAKDAWALVSDGFPILVEESRDRWWLLARKNAWRVEVYEFDFRSGFRSSADAIEVLARSDARQLTRGQLKRLWRPEKVRPSLVGQAAFHTPLSVGHAARSETHTADESHGDHHDPLRRLLRILRLESRDVLTVALFALVAGVMNLATPLAVETLVNTVAWGNLVQPLVALSLILFGFLGFAALLKLLQVIVVEVLQRRLFVRIVGDLAHRFPLARRDALAGEHPAELANRYFDIMTIQKSVAMLVLDGISIVLQTAIGLVLLAFYHPFLLGFDVVLLLMMTLVTYLLGRGGVRTSIDECRVKYAMGHWLQDVISSPTAFRMHGGHAYAVDRANRLTVEYLMERRNHFSVLLRQYAFSLFLLAVASTALLGVGGWLVIRGELTLGQLVASELVVTAIVGAFAKVGKSLESFYDLLAAIDKVGHMLDVPFDMPAGDLATSGPHTQQDVSRIRWQNLPIAIDGQDQRGVTNIAPGSRVAIVGPSGSGKTRLIETLAGLHEPEQGFAEIGGIDVREASRVAEGRLVSLAREPEVFCGSLLENVRLGRSWLTTAEVRQALERVNLWEEILLLPGGMEAELQTGGYPLGYAQCVRLMLARALVSQPHVLLIDGSLDLLGTDQRSSLWTSLSALSPSQTIVIATHDQRIAGDCDLVFRCQPGHASAVH